MSQSFPLLRKDGQTCYWTESGEDLNNDGLLNTTRSLPAEFGGSISRVLIQAKRTNDFNWLLTVRRGGDGRASGIDVVVLFNNGVSPEDEWAYPILPTDGDSTVDSDGDGNKDQ